MSDNWSYVNIAIIVLTVLGLIAARRYLRPFFGRIVICVVPVVLSLIIAGNATKRYLTTGGGFKLGVDLVGGTILVYEVDPEKMDEKKFEDFKPEQLAARLKSRIDPTDIHNVTIRPVNTANVQNTRVEIILPTGGAHQAEVEKKAWDQLLTKVQNEWPSLKEDVRLQSVPRGNRAELVELIHKQGGASTEEADNFIKSNYEFGDESKRKDVTSEQVQNIKNLIAQVGALEFRILANDTDDKAAIEAAKKYVEDAKNKDELKRRAEKGLPPPPPRTEEGDQFLVVDENRVEKGKFSYTWVELSPKERWQLNLNNDAETPWTNTIARLEYHFPALKSLRLREHIKADDYQALREQILREPSVNAAEFEEIISGRERGSENWKKAAEGREKNAVVVLPMSQKEGNSSAVLYSRPVKDTNLTEKQRNEKKYEYFFLTRDPERVPVAGSDKPEVKEVTGNFLIRAEPTIDPKTNNYEVAFGFNTAGANRFHDLTSSNKPTGTEGSKFFRHLAIVLDGQIVSAPSVNTAIRDQGRIMGNFTENEVKDLVNILRAGALPATLKPQPVSENTMGATLGSDTIRAGTMSVGIAFLAVLVFMCIYYRFAGLVASVALLANLLLTIAFMVLVSATFTLPGLAGLVLMLALAVDANVLIYERIREERDRGASLALAIRNGYDRAFPTIIDTHLSSIFTAIVLYAVGNDQLKGFGISLTVGLIISLFTSLYMTRLMFDLWQAKGWLRKLSMLRLLTRTNIDFMAWRRVWFAVTLVLTLLGIGIFVARLPQGLNVDFNGGTLYGGQTVNAMGIGELRNLLDENNQKARLRIGPVEELTADTEHGAAAAFTYGIHYQNDDGSETVRKIEFPNRPEGETPEARTQSVKERASELPDVSVEQIFPSTVKPEDAGRGFFNIRTTEKAPELVQASITRLLGDNLKTTRLVVDKDPNGRAVTLSFRDPTTGADETASPSEVERLLRREARNHGLPYPAPVERLGAEGLYGGYPKLRFAWNEPQIDAAKLDRVLAGLTTEFQERPVPNRLETFDKQLAEETQSRAMYAIIASWGAILLYLWFRFGNWTFGLAAVLCLVHDLFFTLGIIAFCHYIHQFAPGLAGALLIQDFKIDLPAVAALLTLVGYSVNDTIVVFDRIREVRGKNPELTPQMINDSVNQTLSRTLLTSFITWLVVFVLYVAGGDGVHLFAFVMVVGVIVGTYSSIYIASPLLLMFGEGKKRAGVRERHPQPAAVER